MNEVESKRKARRFATMKAREIIYQRASKKKATSDPYTKERERVKKQDGDLVREIKMFKN